MNANLVDQLIDSMTSAKLLYSDPFKNLFPHSKLSLNIKHTLHVRLIFVMDAVGSLIKRRIAER